MDPGGNVETSAENVDVDETQDRPLMVVSSLPPPRQQKKSRTPPTSHYSFTNISTLTPVTDVDVEHGAQR